MCFLTQAFVLLEDQGVVTLYRNDGKAGMTTIFNDGNINVSLTSNRIGDEGCIVRDGNGEAQPVFYKCEHGENRKFDGGKKGDLIITDEFGELKAAFYKSGGFFPFDLDWIDKTYVHCMDFVKENYKPKEYTGSIMFLH